MKLENDTVKETTRSFFWNVSEVATFHMQPENVEKMFPKRLLT